MDTLDVFFGQASPAEARVYVQLKNCDAEALVVNGTISGPYSKFSRTLPARLPFRSAGPGTTLLAEAIVPDPCFWTPETPFTYQVDVEVRRGNEIVAHENRSFGIRPLGARGTHLFMASKRWVIRGGGTTQAEPQGEDLLTQARDAQICFLAANPSQRFLAECSQFGVPVVALLSNDAQDTSRRLDQLARWPALAMVLIDVATDEQQIVESRPPNLLLGQRLRLDGDVPTFQPAAWADVVVGDVVDAALFQQQTKHLALPVIARRAVEELESPDSIRAASEQLQRELAAHGDYAGYLV